jgi:hypothetical protein
VFHTSELQILTLLYLFSRPLSAKTSSYNLLALTGRLPPMTMTQESSFRFDVTR